MRAAECSTTVTQSPLQALCHLTMLKSEEKWGSVHLEITMSKCLFPFFIPFSSELRFVYSGGQLYGIYPSAPSGVALRPPEQQTQNFIGLCQYWLTIRSGTTSFILLFISGFGRGSHAWLHIMLEAGESVIFPLSHFSKASGYRACVSFARIARSSEAVPGNIRFSHWHKYRYLASHISG